MRKTLVAALGFIALALCVCGVTGLWQLRVASTTSAPALFDSPLLRLASTGLIPEDGQAAIDLANFAGQISNRMLSLIAIGLMLLIFSGFLLHLTRRQNLKVVHAEN